MSIRLRTIDGVRVALCAARSMPQDGDVYLDDGEHEALARKFGRDWNYLPDSHEALAEAAESNNPNRAQWDATYGQEVKQQKDALAASQREAEQTCGWSYMCYPESESDFEGACGVAWSMTVGGLEENGMNFCPRCGGKIVFFAPTPDDDDDAALRPEVAK